MVYGSIDFFNLVDLNFVSWLLNWLLNQVYLIL